MIKRLKSWLQRHSRSYDIAQPSRFLDAHFADADGRDADALIEISLETARNKCRYEVRNNSYAKGIIDTLANDIVGTGPRLQLKTADEAFNRVAEARWQAWIEQCDATGRLEMADLLRLCVLQQCESGESFSHLFYQPHDRQSEGLRLLMIEPDRINTPFGMLYDDQVVQGVRMDLLGRPVLYYVQKEHPGSLKSGMGGAITEYDTVPADQMIHLARIDRPGQTRGMPWLTPALPLFAQLRRYTLAVIRNAENAAATTGLLESDQLAGEVEPVEEFESLDIEHNQMMTLPSGWRFNQVKPEQPVDTYAMFKHEIINEIARCVSMPYNVAAANSAEYNYASGRLDWQVYYRHIDVIRRWLAQHLLNRILRVWLAEAVLIDPALAAAPPINRNMVDWYWPGAEHVDPAKEATAQDIHLKNLSTTYAAVYARQGKDYQVEFEQIAREKRLMEQLKIKPEEVPAHEKNQTPQSNDNDDDENDRRSPQLRCVR